MPDNKNTITYVLVLVTCRCKTCQQDKVSGKKIIAARIEDDNYTYVYRYLSPVDMYSNELPKYAVQELALIDLDNL